MLLLKRLFLFLIFGMAVLTLGFPLRSPHLHRISTKSSCCSPIVTPGSGTYTVVIDPQGARTGGVTITLASC